MDGSFLSKVIDMWKKITDVVNLEDYKNKKDSQAEPLGGIGQRVYLPNELVIGCPTGLCGNDPARKGQPYLDAGCPVHRDVAMAAVNKRGVEVVDTKASEGAFQGLPSGTREEAMSRHPSGTGEGDTALEGSGEGLPNNVLPFKHKGNIMEDISKKRVMSNEFNERTASTSTGIWDESKEFEKEASITDYLHNQEEILNNTNTNTGLLATTPPVVAPTFQPNPEAEALLQEGVSDEQNWQLSDKDRKTMGLQPAKSHGDAALLQKQYNTLSPADLTGPVVKRANIGEKLPNWIEDARQIIAHDAKFHRDDEIEGQIDEKIYNREPSDLAEKPADKGCPWNECPHAEKEHCGDCGACPGDDHDGGLHRERGPDDYDDSMDGDWDSGMASAGFGTDEDYGHFGGDE